MDIDAKTPVDLGSTPEVATIEYSTDDSLNWKTYSIVMLGTGSAR